ncbi:MAG TPA: lipocalin-like domain-containing protein [Candidatus Acidoferrales bacterium]|nr:lipocalin-like domain-containing protein [Candidatus Acidoferrales bacterium]
MTRALHRRAARLLAACSAALLLLPPLAARSGPEQWELALPGYRYEFPRDHFNHPGYQTEWWYYTGNVRAEDGRRFGFELTFFRQGIARRAAPDPATSPWDVNELFLAHLALSDLDGKNFLHTERLNRAGPGLAGADASTGLIWNGNWEVRFDQAKPGEQPVQLLQAICDDFSLRLTMRSQKPAVIHGTGGVSQKGPARGQASHYISYTHLDATGTLELGDNKFSVSGLAWMDHEFFTSQLAPEQTGWDWISVQLGNNEELMLYRLRRRDGARDPFSAGTFVDARGVARHLSATDFSMAPGTAWQSDLTGASYPVRWSILVPSLRLELDVLTPLENQELVSSRPNWPTYWEGTVIVNGIEHAQAVDGTGYLEMTGYDRPVTLPK